MALILQFFKYLGVLNRRLQIVYKTMIRVTGDLVYWVILLFIVLLGLVVSGTTFFGSDTQDFSTFYNGFNAILRLVIMDFQFDAIANATPYIVVSVCILLLMFEVSFSTFGISLTIYSLVSSDNLLSCIYPLLLLLLLPLPPPTPASRYHIISCPLWLCTFCCSPY